MTPSSGQLASCQRCHSSTYTSWSNVPGRRSPGLGSTRHRPPLAGSYVMAASSAESLSRKTGSASSERSRTIVRAPVRRRAARDMRDKVARSGRGESSPSRAYPNGDDLSRHRLRCVGAKPEDDARDVFALDEGGVGPHALYVRRRSNGRGRDRVGTHAVRALFLGDGAHESEDAALRRDVGSHVLRRRARPAPRRIRNTRTRRALRARAAEMRGS